MPEHELKQRKEKYYAGEIKKRKRLVRRKNRCTCGFSTHSTRKMSEHFKKYSQ